MISRKLYSYVGLLLLQAFEPRASNRKSNVLTNRLRRSKKKHNWRHCLRLVFNSKFHNLYKYEREQYKRFIFSCTCCVLCAVCRSPFSYDRRCHSSCIVVRYSSDCWPALIPVRCSISAKSIGKRARPTIPDGPASTGRCRWTHRSCECADSRRPKVNATIKQNSRCWIFKAHAVPWTWNVCRSRR